MARLTRLTELDELLLYFLDPFYDYLKIIQLNKYHKNLVERNHIYQEFKKCHQTLIEWNLDKEYPQTLLANLIKRITNSFEHPIESKWFILANERQYENVKKYFYKLLKIDDHYSMHVIHAFNIACCYGNVNTAKWLLNIWKTNENKKLIYDMTIYSWDNQSLKPLIIWNAYYLKNLHRGNTKIIDYILPIFLHTCEIGDKECAKMLFDLSKNENREINIANLYTSLYFASRNVVHRDLEEWLNDLIKAHNSS